MRNAKVSDYCNYKNGLVFGLGEEENDVSIVSRALLTNSYNLSQQSVTSMLPCSVNDGSLISENLSDLDFIIAEEIFLSKKVRL